jgi:hypothetical protein
MLPKKENRLDVQEFRPISLIHAFSKIMTKILAARLAPLLPSLISKAQCAFVQGRSIHENYKLLANPSKYSRQEPLPLRPSEATGDLCRWIRMI